MSSTDPIEARLDDLDATISVLRQRMDQTDRRLASTVESLERLARLTTTLAERQLAFDASLEALGEKLAELTDDVRRLFDGMSDHLRNHPGPGPSAT